MAKPLEIIDKNLDALLKTSPPIYAWLQKRSEPDAVEALTADDGGTILSVNGQSQDSRRSPIKAARDFVAKYSSPLASSSQCWLFGLGSPILLNQLLSQRAKVWVLEPRLEVLWRALTVMDFSQPILKGQLIFRLMSDLSDNSEPDSAQLIVHPPSGRALKPQLARLEDFLSQRDQKSLSPQCEPKILIIGPFSGGSVTIGPSLKEASLSLSLPTRLMAWSPEILTLAQSLTQNYKLSSNADFSRLMAQAAQEIRFVLEAFEPDLVLALAQAPLGLESLSSLKKEFNCLWAFWFVEDWRLFHYVDSVAPLYDLFFHIQGADIQEKILSWGLKRAFYLPLAADPNFFRPRATVPQEYQAQVSFMGAGYPNRRRIFSELLTNYWPNSDHEPSDFKIFGSGWEGADEAIIARLFERGRRVSRAETSLIYAGSRINLNIHSANDAGFNPQAAFVNPRTFEIAASQAFQLVDPRPLLGELFTTEEVAIVNNPQELPEKIEYYLTRPKKRQEMAQMARARVLAEHTFAHRLKTILQRAKNL
ncbi:MAG: glycosyltransferase [Deltaproteobacteria bacterium]|jgi:spore maturation protein CgeB|nr:glycosyltransferase [Deltaproteobacteria bacterium]